MSPETLPVRRKPKKKPKNSYFPTSSGVTMGSKKYKTHGGHGSVSSSLPLSNEHEYRVVKNFPNLASDSLSLSQRRHTRKRRMPKLGGGGSMASTRSVRSVMSGLTKSPFEGDGINPSEAVMKGPLTEIRRNMMVKKRHARVPLPAIGKRELRKAVERGTSTSPLQSALEKVKKAAKNYDRYRDGTALTSCFADYQMEVSEFRMQMKRAMGVDLSRREAEALLEKADKDGNGTLDGAEFLLMFFDMAHKEHSDDMRQRQKMKELVREMEKVNVKKKEEERVMKDEKCFSRNFTEEDAKRVMKRLSRYALEFDKMSEVGKRTSAAFSCVLRPHELKEQLLKSFNMKVTKPELGALISHFDRDGDGDVSGAEFMVQFSRMGMIAKRREREKSRREVQKKLESGMILPLVHKSLGR